MSLGIVQPSFDDFGIVGGDVCLDVWAGGVAHLDLLGVEDAVEWGRWREMLPDQSKELSSHISSDIRRTWRVKPKNISMAFLASLLLHRLDVDQLDQCSQTPPL